MKSIIIHEFMIKDLYLSGVKLLLYALIYSFTQFGQGFFVSDKVVCSFLHISRSQYFAAKKSLIDRQLVVCDPKSNKLYCARCVMDEDLNNEELAEAIRLARLNLYYD